MRRLSVLGLLPVLLLSLTGCGATAADAATIVRAVPAKTEKAKTAHAALTISGTANGTKVNATGDGVVDLTNNRADLTLDLGQMAGGIGKVRALQVGTVLYMQLPPALQSQIPGAKPFLKLDLEALSKQAGFDLGALQGNTDASSQLAFLTGAGSDFKKVGTEKIRGVSTTHYQGTIDLAKAAAAAPPQRKAALDKVREKLGTNTIPMDAWVDGQGRLRKMTSHMDLSKAVGAKPGADNKSDVTLELFDYGAPVNITEPPADQVTDLGALLGSLGANGSGSTTKRP